MYNFLPLVQRILVANVADFIVKANNIYAFICVNNPATCFTLKLKYEPMQ